jgi:hypothetical protein
MRKCLTRLIQPTQKAARLISDVQQMLDCCLEPGNIEALKMRDLQTKSAHFALD